MQLEGSNKLIETIDLLYIGATSGAGAIAWHIWIGEKVESRRLVALFVISAIFAVIVFLWTWPDMANKATQHVAVSILCGIGATDLVATILAMVRSRISAGDGEK